MTFALPASASITAARRALRAALGWSFVLVLVCAPVSAADLQPKDDDTAGQELLSDPSFLRPAPLYVDAVRQPAPARFTEVQGTRNPENAPNDDPFESINRYAHEFNTFMRRHLLEPVTVAYLQHTSRPVQQGISNIFTNLREPMIVASNLLLGDTQGANNAATRFVINTTAGLGGYYDRAAEEGYPRRPRTLEEVLCRYGVPAGPYVVLPVLGPATVRDGAGRLTTLFIQYVVLGPVYIPYRIADIAVQYAELREQLRFIESHSLDPYTAHRSAHKQLHARLACDGQAVHIELFGQ